jgi:hypothetical protein
VDALAPLLERLGLRSLTLDAAAGPTAAAAALADLDHGRA